MIDILRNGANTYFPESDCIIQNEREPNVKEGETYYWCLLQDKRFEDSYEIKKLRPYTCLDEDNILYYGWLDKWGNYYDNNEKPIHTDNLQVIGWTTCQ